MPYVEVVTRVAFKAVALDYMPKTGDFYLVNIRKIKIKKIAK